MTACRRPAIGAQRSAPLVRCDALIGPPRRFKQPSAGNAVTAVTRAVYVLWVAVVLWPIGGDVAWAQSAIAPSFAVTTTAANLRAEPTSDSRIIAVVNPGAQVQVLATVGEWSEIAVAGYTGFVYAPLLSTRENSGTAVQRNGDAIPPGLVGMMIVVALLVVVAAVVVAVVKHVPDDQSKLTLDAPTAPQFSGTTAWVITRTCSSCGDDYAWLTSEEQSVGAPNASPDETQCPACRNATRPFASQESTTRPETETATAAPLASRLAIPSPSPVLDHHAAFGDINSMLAQGMQPVEVTPVGGWQAFWAGGTENVWKKRRSHNAQIIDEADRMIVQRRDLFRNAHDMLMAAASVQQADVDMRSRALESHLRSVKLHEEVREHEALAALRLETKRLQELAAQARAKASMHPSEERHDPDDEQRRARRARVRAEEERVEEFVSEVTRICEDGRIDGAKAVLIRRLLTLYQLGEEALPAEVRAMLQLAEEEA